MGESVEGAARNASCLKVVNQSKHKRVKRMKLPNRVELILRDAHLSEESCAGKSHAGICEGDVRQLTFLP